MADVRIPGHVDDLKLKKFSRWLGDHGAEILQPSNPYEVLRFRANGEVSIIYRKASGSLTWSGQSETAYRSYVNGGKWHSVKKKASRKSGNRRRAHIIATLRERDGNDCFYCGHEVEADDETIEHLLSIGHGGTYHMANMALAHARCNKVAGNKSIFEKIKLRELKRARQ